jgi:hypothetical protein
MKTVVIIGTIHRPTEAYSKYDLLRLITDVKPKLILEELPDSFYNESGKRKIKRNYESQEEYAIDSYSKEYGVAVVPYDIHDRQKYIQDLNLVENEDKLFLAIDNILSSKDIPYRQMKIVEKSNEYFNIRDEILNNGKWNEINSKRFDRVNEHKEKWLSRLYTEVVPSNKKLSEYSEFCNNYLKFWNTRNLGMCENIKKLAVEGKVTVVLAGVEHRSIFFSLLKDSEEVHYYSIEDYLKKES